MTTKADFTDQEWEVVREAPTSAGMIVATAERGGTFREAFSMAKAYTEARKQHGESELLDEIVSAKPDVDRSRHGSVEELKQASLQKVRDAVALVEQKATPEELDEYRRFIHGLAERVGAAKDEAGGGPASDAEQAAIAEIDDALGASSA
jgi:hypothetical protein